MAFAVSAFVLLAACFQSSFAAVAVESTSTSTATTMTASTVAGPTLTAPGASTLGIMNPASAVNNMNLVNNLYNSPFIPQDNHYGIDLLYGFPHYMACDCDLSALIDATVFTELSLVTAKYNQRNCDLQQWERLINIAMPGIDAVNELNMLASLASSVQREQMRQNLVYGSYPPFCVNYQAAIAAASAATVDPVLYRREPQVATATSTASTTTVTTNAALPWDNSPAYYTMQYLMDRALPNLSPELRLDIINSVMANTPAQYWNSAYALAQQLTSNIRGMVSDMVDLSVPSVTVTY